jgi:Na+/proline symporter
MKIDSIRIIQKISKFISISFLTISCIITLILLYILLGGSLEGNIEIDTMINNSNNSNEYKNFNVVPLPTKLFMVLFIVTILFLINTILRYWDKFMSSVKKGEYFEINTIKNLKYISFILTGIWLVLFIVEVITDITMRTSVNLNDNIISEITDLGFSIPPLSYLIVSMILWVISHILIEGIKIKKENELTI